MKETKILLFNGPPNSGKDTGADYITKHLRIPKIKFSTPAKEGTHVSLDLPATVDQYEQNKDNPSDDFFGLTPRQAYIAHSEAYMKVIYGADIFAKLFIRHISEWAIFQKQFVVSDCGFDIEFLTLLEHYGAENIGLIRLTRDGCTFANDSRNWIVPPSNVTDHIIYFIDNKHIDKYRQEVLATAKKFFGIK